MILHMRTTVTIDADTERLLRDEARRTGNSFKVVLNESIRRALAKPSSERIRVEPIFTNPFPPELGNINMNQLADELDDQETLRKLSR